MTRDRCWNVAREGHQADCPVVREEAADRARADRARADRARADRLLARGMVERDGRLVAVEDIEDAAVDADAIARLLSWVEVHEHPARPLIGLRSPAVIATNADEPMGGWSEAEKRAAWGDR